MSFFRRPSPAAPSHTPGRTAATSQEFDVLEYAQEMDLTPAQDDDVFYAVHPPVELHVTRHFGEIAAEQEPLYRARGEAASRAARAKAQALIPAASTQATIIQLATERLQRADDILVNDVVALQPDRRRTRTTSRLYPLFQVGLSMGDGVGCGLSLVMAGEDPLIVWPLSLALGIAIMLIGTSVGKEYKQKIGAAMREGDVPESAERHRRLYVVSERAWAAMNESVRVHAIVGVTVCLAIGVAYGVLRSDDLALALFFGVAQVVVAVGSAANSYMFADEVADVQDNTKARSEEFVRDALEASNGGSLEEQIMNHELAESLRREFEAAGEGAWHRTRAAGIEPLIRHPQYAGTGMPTSAPPAPNGKTKANSLKDLKPFKAGRGGSTNGNAKDGRS